MLPDYLSRHAISALLRCRILFVEVSPQQVELDCVLTEPAFGLTVGTPFVVLAELPHASWASAARAALERWAAHGREVELTLRIERELARADVSDGETRLLLDVAGCAGL